MCISAQSVRAATGPRACAEVAATLEFSESSENVVALSCSIGKLAFASFSPSSSSSSSSPSDPYFVLPGPDQLLSNAFCSTCIGSFEPDLRSARDFPSPAARRSRVWGRCSNGEHSPTCVHREGGKNVRHDLCYQCRNVARTGPWR